jgi:type II secretory pathway component GspD/PulD (secretin)
MVFLRPTVVHSAEDAAALKLKIDEKTPLLKKWKEDAAAKPSSK